MNEPEVRRYEEGERAVRALLRMSPDRAFRDLQRRQPEADRGWFFYASAERYRTMSNYQAAATSLREALREDPASPLTAAAYIYLLGDGPGRIQVLASLCREWTTLERPRLYLGFALLESGQFGQAVQALRACTELAPDDVSAWAGLASALLSLGERAAAGRAATVLLQLSDASFLIERLAARLLFQAGHRRQAVAAAFRSARRFPGVRSVLCAVALPFIAGSRRSVRVVALVALGLLLFGLGASGRLAWISLAMGGTIVALFELAGHASGDIAAQRNWLRFLPQRERLGDEARRGAGGVPPVLAPVSPAPVPAPRGRLRRALTVGLVAALMGTAMLLKTSGGGEPPLRFRPPPGLAGQGRIAYVLGPAEGKSRIYVMNADGSGARALTEPPSGLADIEPAFSPDGSRVAFVRVPIGESHGDIWVIDGHGGNELQLSVLIATEYPAWSPDGTRILFDAEKGITQGNVTVEVHELYVMRADGSDPIRLIACDPPACASDALPAWAPDGERIAFTRAVLQPGQTFPFSTAVVIANADGTGLQAIGCPLPDCHGLDSTPAWSPDGSSLAFSRRGEIVVAEADGSDVRAVSQCERIPGCETASSPTWSADGREIAFTVNTGQFEHAQIYVTSADGMYVFPLARSGPDSCCPTWSASG